LYVGFVVVLIFIAIGSLYVLGTLVAVPTLQLLTSAISAASAVASASAAILIWRSNVQARKTVLIDRVLGPLYSEMRYNREVLESWKTDAREIALKTQFLAQAPSDWLYYTLDPEMRADIESFKTLVPILDQQKQLSKRAAGSIIRDAAKKVFDIPDRINQVYLWRSHTWVEGQPTGETGRGPELELVLDTDPLRAEPGYYVHSLQVVNTDNQTAKSFPLLSTQKAPLNDSTFREFWLLARETASKDSTIKEFREQFGRAIHESSSLERKLDSDIKHLR